MRLKNSIVVEQNGKLIKTNVTRYNAEGEPVKKGSVWMKQEEVAEKMYNVLKRNDDNGLSSADLADFQALSTLDIELQANDMPDNIADKIVHDASPKSNGFDTSKVTETTALREYLDPIGYFKEISGTNDKVHLMDKNILADTMTLTIKGLGYKNSLLNTLANTLDDPSGVNRAFARALVIEKNREVLQPIVQASYTGNTLTASTGGTFFQNVFDTLVKGIFAVGQNVYEAGGSSIKVGDMSGRTIILVPQNYAEALAMQPSLSSFDRPVTAMIGAEIIGVASTFAPKYGAESSPVVTIPANTAYIIRLPDNQESHLRVAPVEILSKSGEGDTLEGAPFTVANFRYSGIFNKYLLPNGAGKGCIVKATLPAVTLT